MLLLKLIQKTAARNKNIISITGAKLTNGESGAAVGASRQIEYLEDMLVKSNNVVVAVVCDGGIEDTSYKQKLTELCEESKKMLAILSVPEANETHPDALGEIARYKSLYLNANTSYAALITPHVKISHPSADVDVSLSPDVILARKIAENAADGNFTLAPAGISRGLVSANRLVRVFNQAERDTLALNRINFIKQDSRYGFYINSQFTLHPTESALDRINVRLTINQVYIELVPSLEQYRFEINDEATRSSLVVLASNYLDTLVTNRSLTAYEVIADDSNNTASDIQNNRMNVTIQLQPSRTAEIITITVPIVNQIN